MSRVSKLIKKYGIINFMFLAVFYTINKISRDFFYTWKKDDFAFKEALFWSKDIDQFLRYSKIMGEIKKIEPDFSRKIRILDVGAGGEGIAKFLKYSKDLEKYEVYLADINADLLSGVKLGTPVIIKDKILPFSDNEFDIVVSVDALEHIPKPERQNFLKELKRVGKIILLHFVMDDPANNFMGRDADIRFNKWHLEKFNIDNPWTIEHLSVEPPTCSEINTLLPQASITGTQNINVWFECITSSMKPISGFFSGFSYIRKGKEFYNTPPFHGCFVKWHKRFDL